MHVGKDEHGVSKYDARIMYAVPTPGLAEVEPSMNWNPSVVAGIGVVADPAVLYEDMHSYLASSGQVTDIVAACEACLSAVRVPCRVYCCMPGGALLTSRAGDWHTCSAVRSLVRFWKTIELVVFRHDYLLVLE